ncbi:MAG: NADH:ubiquinone oxidoreductase [Ignavibacteriae bacterium]|nr:MAG: NADH:ubiquinone oxidoreductase [Ignavibacteriota bacterium]
MLDLIKLRIRHGYQSIGNLRTAVLMESHRGFPEILTSIKIEDEQKIAGCCPTKAITGNPVTIDLGKCIFCGECERISNGAIRFTNDYKLGTSKKDQLLIAPGTVYQEYRASAIEAKKKIHSLFGRSLKLRQVSAGGCNGCEMELSACGNVNFDMGRFGIDFVASPRHADGIVLTGPITKNMAPALMDAYKSVNDPKIVIAVGACAISGGLFADSDELNREFLDKIKVDLYIPGCPPHPLTIINAILELIGKESR